MRPGVTDPFVPNGDSRKETAILLVGTADEYGIDQRAIRAVNGGFFITEELADLIYHEDDESEPEPEPQPEPAKKTSGNRAAKNTSTKVTDKE